MARKSTGEHFCQSELQGTVENRSLLAGGVAFDILRCWKDDHLQTSEYSLQGKYKGKVTNTTENGVTPSSCRAAPGFAYTGIQGHLPKGVGTVVGTQL